MVVIRDGMPKKNTQETFPILIFTFLNFFLWATICLSQNYKFSFWQIKPKLDNRLMVQEKKKTNAESFADLII